MAHALTSRNEFLREHSGVLTLSVGLHVALFVLLVLNLSLLPRREPQPTRLAIEATVVDAKAQRRRAVEEEARRRQALEAEQRRRDQAAEARRQDEQRREERRQAEAERRRADEQRVAEQRRAEQQKREQADAKAREAQAARQRQEAEAKAAQQKQAEADRKAAAEAARKAEAARRAAQAKADLARQMAEEEDLLAAADSGLLDKYAEVIRQKVERNWIRPASAREGISCVVLVKQIPGGEVVDVRVSECNGDAAVVRSIEAAVIRASPLPPPPDPSLFDRSLRFDFRPRD